MVAKILLTIILISIIVAIGNNLLSRRSRGSRSSASSSPGQGSVSPQLWRRLVKLTRDETTAQRLFRNVQLKHPDRNANWCCEKAIYDLERDRYRR